MGAIRECKPVLLLIAAFAASEEAMQRGKELAEREFVRLAFDIGKDSRIDQILEDPKAFRKRLPHFFGVIWSEVVEAIGFAF